MIYFISLQEYVELFRYKRFLVIIKALHYSRCHHDNGCSARLLFENQKWMFM